MAGVDQSKEMLKQCHQKFPEMETKLGNFLAIPYLDGRFDFVVSSFVFHHLTTDQKLLAIEEMRRVLKPHGRICITDVMVVEEQHHHHAEDYTSLTELISWFEEKRYVTKHYQLNEFLHIFYAIPIR